MKEKTYTAIIAITAVISVISSIISISQTWSVIKYQTTPKTDLYVSESGRSFPNLLCKELEVPYAISAGPGTLSYPGALNEDLELIVRFANVGYVPVNIYTIYLISDCLSHGIYIIPIPENKKLVIGPGEDIESNYTVNKNYFINQTKCLFNVTVSSNVGENSCSFYVAKG
jgi:hypothetical protein